jgi:predicted O-methyltransferase YrrM
MKRASMTVGMLLAMALAAPGQNPAAGQFHPSTMDLAKTETGKRILAVLDQIMQAHETYLNVPPQDGRALRLLVEAAGVKRMVEIGTSTGYSGLWLSLALEATGGHLTTFELDHQRATMAHQHFAQAGVENLVTIVEGDAHEQVLKLKGPLDAAFIDADKPGYVDYLNKILPLLRPGGLLLAHNVEMVPDYVQAVTTNPDLVTIFFMQGNGLAVTLKKH